MLAATHRPFGLHGCTKQYFYSILVDINAFPQQLAEFRNVCVKISNYQTINSRVMEELFSGPLTQNHIETAYIMSCCGGGAHLKMDGNLKYTARKQKWKDQFVLENFSELFPGIMDRGDGWCSREKRWDSSLHGWEENNWKKHYSTR